MQEPYPQRYRPWQAKTATVFAAEFGKSLNYIELMVPGDGFEPPTRGFSRLVLQISC
jgi:hypothetical protein